MTDDRTAAKRKRREEREAELGARQRALPDKRYGVIYADPPWRFEPYSRETGMGRAADNHYPTMDVNRIQSMASGIAGITAPDCVLFLWATAPMLPEALAVMQAWGFEYKSHCIWFKPRRATGYWFRGAHELLLVGTRGQIPAPAPGTQWPSIIRAPAGAHSVKPQWFRRAIEVLFPTLPRIELFARTHSRGWDVWGQEVAEPKGLP